MFEFSIEYYSLFSLSASSIQLKKCTLIQKKQYSSFPLWPGLVCKIMWHTKRVELRFVEIYHNTHGDPQESKIKILYVTIK